PHADVHQGARENRRSDAEYMAAPDQLLKITMPLATREPSIHGPSPLANAKIRRLHFAEGKGIKTICRDLKLPKSEACAAKTTPNGAQGDPHRDDGVHL
ncbi:hypothetical protein, partial [Paenirhodobacter populi]|uniref:hypothetical protein n=1 Tax=Paenirhodobacter populi TaxID=2306993 RepID=UPI0019D4D9CC